MILVFSGEKPQDVRKYSQKYPHLCVQHKGFFQPALMCATLSCAMNRNSEAPVTGIASLLPCERHPKLAVNAPCKQSRMSYGVLLRCGSVRDCGRWYIGISESGQSLPLLELLALPSTQCAPRPGRLSKLRVVQETGGLYFSPHL